MTQTNRLGKIVKATSKLPSGIRSTVLSKAFGRVVPMVGTAKLRYIDITPSRVEVKLENNKNMQNHIGQAHACAMALVAETATGFVTGMNIPDSCIVFSVHDKFHRTLILSGFCLLKIAKISLNSSFFPKPIKR